MKKVMIGFSLFFATAAAFAWNGYNYNDYQVNSYSEVTYSPDYRVCAVAITRDLRMGSQNSEVTTLQDYLHSQGYLVAAPNGYFGSATRKAVMIFQADHGIATTGSVGPQTRQEINDEICNVDSLLFSGSYSLPSVAHTTQIPTTYVSTVDPFITSATQINYSVPTNVGSYPTINYGTSYQAPVVVTAPPVVPTLPAYIPPASTEIQATTIINNPASGYTYGIIPKTTSITIASPLSNSFYNEGDSINVVWTPSNLNAPQYQILLENTVTGQSKVATVTSGTSATILLSKELLDSVCAGVCDNNQQGSFRVVIATPVTDIAGKTTMFRAMVNPITIKRPLGFFGTVSITANKTPVNSTEPFKLYTNIPTGASWNANIYSQYSFRIHAICPSGVTVSIAGVPCGQDFTLPFTPSFFQQEIPTVITNPTWYRQEVIFEMVVTNFSGQVIGTSRATVVVNPTPFSW